MRGWVKPKNARVVCVCVCVCGVGMGKITYENAWHGSGGGGLNRQNNKNKEERYAPEGRDDAVVLGDARAAPVVGHAVCVCVCVCVCCCCCCCCFLGGDRSEEEVLKKKKGWEDKPSR